MVDRVNERHVDKMWFLRVRLRPRIRVIQHGHAQYHFQIVQGRVRSMWFASAHQIEWRQQVRRRSTPGLDLLEPPGWGLFSVTAPTRAGLRQWWRRLDMELGLWLWLRGRGFPSQALQNTQTTA